MHKVFSLLASTQGLLLVSFSAEAYDEPLEPRRKSKVLDAKEEGGRRRKLDKAACLSLETGIMVLV